jgi:hypothetical protein
MSLLRLLTAGKSLVGVKESEGRYHLSRQSRLPEFNAKRNPFRGTARPEGKAPAKPADQETAMVAAAPAPEPQAAKAAAETPGKRPAAPFGGGFAARGSGVASWVRQRLARMFNKPGRAAARSVAAAKPAPTAAKRPMQTELSLDAVRVVRNDLSDSDLEVVAVKPAAEKTPATGTGRAGGAVALAGSAWSRVTERVLGAGKT